MKNENVFQLKQVMFQINFCDFFALFVYREGIFSILFKSFLFPFRDWPAFYVLSGQVGCVIVGVLLLFAASIGADKRPTFGRTNFLGPPTFLEFSMTNPRSFAEIPKPRWAQLLHRFLCQGKGLSIENFLSIRVSLWNRFSIEC